ncbi:DnaJ domain-containing protein [Strongyloides ratti]|uniref:DnaJ domain-containing protein n=1 Tax=Strongyloides ratti TaxID=34506 RepID=A0A090KX07_STRRB|nr:DnaJ domain-containing protein [Strongyloides ratti]CEF62040.1 DnaJ domain-containing protein [Strongyloides ratti]
MNIYQSLYRIQKSFYRRASYDIKKKNYYEILGIPRDASNNEIKKAFFEKSRELHPDGDLYINNNDNNSIDKNYWSFKSKTILFMELKDAYDVLKKSDTRAEYDSKLFDLESRDGYLMECTSRDRFMRKNISNLLYKGSPSIKNSIRDVGGHFLDPNELYEREERNKRYFIYGITIFMLTRRNVTWRFMRYLNYSSQKSFYEILGVSPSASKSEIKAKFYELSKKYHPDVINDKDSKENSLKFREISEAYETLKNDEKRSQYDRSRGYGNNQFWQAHDFSNYQNPNGGYYYHKQTFYYGPDKKFSQQRSSRYTQKDFEDIWRRFNKKMNSEEQKEYEKYQEFLRNTLWKEYHARRDEAWKKHREEYEKKNNPFFFFTGTFAKIAGIYIGIFFVITLFQVFFDRNFMGSRRIMKKNDNSGEQVINEDMYKPININNIPLNSGNIHDNTNVDQNTFPYGMPK